MLGAEVAVKTKTLTDKQEEERKNNERTRSKESMKQYKVEALIYYTKLTFDTEHIVKSSKSDIQQKLDQYAGDGWRLVSTNATNFGFAVYIYLYFEKDASS